MPQHTENPCFSWGNLVPLTREEAHKLGSVVQLDGDTASRGFSLAAALAITHADGDTDGGWEGTPEILFCRHYLTAPRARRVTWDLHAAFTRKDGGKTFGRFLGRVETSRTRRNGRTILRIVSVEPRR